MTRGPEDLHPNEPQDNLRIDWGKHSLNDDCEWNTEGIALGYKEVSGKEKREAHTTIQAFLDTERSLEKRLGIGQRFDFKTHNIGTIVKFERDECHTGVGYETISIYWGIVSETKSKNGESVRSMVYFRESVMGGLAPAHFLGNDTIENIDIGEITHEKWNIPQRQWQELRRVNWVEVWRFGHGERKTTPQQSPNTFGRLVPKPSEA